MSIDFHNANEVLRFLEGKGVDTSRGRMFLASDVEEAVKLYEESRLGRVVGPRPKTMVQAKRMVRQNEELMTQMKPDQTTDPDPLSRA